MMLLEEIKNVIKYVIELDIDYLETFLGYEGDKVIKVTTKTKDTVELIKSYLDNLGLKYKVEYKYESGYFFYVGIEEPDFFQLKRT